MLNAPRRTRHKTRTLISTQSTLYSTSVLVLTPEYSSTRILVVAYTMLVRACQRVDNYTLLNYGYWSKLLYYYY